MGTSAYEQYLAEQSDPESVYAKYLAEQKRAKAPAPESSLGLKAATFLDRLAGAASFGVGPLVGDAIAAGIDPDQSFADVRKARSERNAALGPIGYAADVAGGLLTGGASLGALKAIPKVAAMGWKGKTALAAADAALQGGVTGAAEGLNDTSAEGLANAANMAKWGAGAGLLLGGAGGAIAGKVGARAVPSYRATVADLTAKGVNLKEAQAIVKQLENADPATIKAALAKVDEIAALGKGADVMAADVLGREGGRMLRAATNISPAANEKAGLLLRTRDANVGPRAMKDLGEAAGFTPKETAAALDDMATARSQAAAPLYASFRGLGQLPRTPALQTIFKLPMVQQALKTVKGESTELAKLPWLDARVLDAVYKRIGSRAFKATHGYEPGTTRNALRDAIDEASGGQYVPALEAFAGPSAAIDAYEVGKSLLGKRAGDFRGALRDNPDAPDFLKKGLIDSAGEQIAMRAPNPDLGPAARAATGVGQQAIGTMNSAAVMREALGDGYDKLVPRAKTEGLFAQTSNAVQGNSTSAQQASDALGVIGETAANLGASLAVNPAWMVTMFGRREIGSGISRHLFKLAKADANRVAGGLTAQGEQATKKVLTGLLGELDRRRSLTEAEQFIRERARTALARASAPNR